MEQADLLKDAGEAPCSLLDSQQTGESRQSKSRKKRDGHRTVTVHGKRGSSGRNDCFHAGFKSHLF